jgi:glycine dehydrogenase subunit 1
MGFVPHTPEDEKEMLAAIGVASVEGLFSASIPDALRLQRDLALPPAMPECRVRAHMDALSMRNVTTGCTCSFVGAGIYDHYVPAAVGAITSRSEFYTAYTPYQPEVSQGTLQAIFEFQTMVARLMQMEVASASLYDASTALAEAAGMALRVFRGKRPRLVFAGAHHPEYLQVVKTQLVDAAEAVQVVPAGSDGRVDGAALQAAMGPDVAALFVQSPNFLGIVEDLEGMRKVADAHGSLLVASFCEPLAFGLLKPPGALGADIAVGEGQSLGMPPSFGGPLLGLMTARKEFVRSMPGRLVGKTSDRNGEQCFVVTLATREQHIRRAKATSNICTNEGLCALSAAIYMSLLGNDGFRKLAEVNHRTALYLASRLSAIRGVTLPYAGSPWFNELVVELPVEAAGVHREMATRGFVAGVPLSRFYPGADRRLLLAATEMNSRACIDRFCAALADVVG